jgi:hypothetical protein
MLELLACETCDKCNLFLTVKMMNVKKELMKNHAKLNVFLGFLVSQN